MKKVQKLLTLFVLIVLTTFSLHAWDFGLILDQTADYNSHGPEFADSELYYYGILIPRFSTLLGDNGEVVVSAGLNYDVNPAAVIPELLRADFTWRFGMGELKVGRMPYSDPLELVAEGLFDGAHFSYDARGGTFTAGAWYTGLLNKDRAAIAMTEDELEATYTALDYNDFANTYFAPRRVLASLGWEHPDLGGMFDTKLALLGQFDATGADLHSQYLAAKIEMPHGDFLFGVGGCLEVMEHCGACTMALLGELDCTWMPPSPFEQLVSFRGTFSSGVVEDSSIGAFLPLTTMPHGNLLQAGISGLSVLSLDYVARLHRALSANFNASYFIRSDLGTYAEYPVTGVDSNGFFLGMELFGGVVWSLSSEIQVNLGLGAFLPSLGDAAPNADALWRAQLNVVLMVF